MPTLFPSRSSKLIDLKTFKNVGKRRYSNQRRQSQTVGDDDDDGDSGQTQFRRQPHTRLNTTDSTKLKTSRPLLILAPRLGRTAQYGGSFSADLQMAAGGGGLVRDFMGALLAGFCTPLRATSSFDAEFQVLLHGLRFAIQYSNHIWIEMDAASVVLVLQSGRPGSAVTRHTLTSIHLLCRGRHVWFSHIPSFSVQLSVHRYLTYSRSTLSTPLPLISFSSLLFWASSTEGKTLLIGRSSNNSSSVPHSGNRPPQFSSSLAAPTQLERWRETPKSKADSELMDSLPASKSSPATAMTRRKSTENNHNALTVLSLRSPVIAHLLFELDFPFVDIYSVPVMALLVIFNLSH
ncbi:hypothetical protein C2S52_006536 [Perilla frutescens var. hirtella]|nr:hypothetical protein C2S52_006536 [Perilla frutescens var. hirtella]